MAVAAVAVLAQHRRPLLPLPLFSHLSLHLPLCLLLLLLPGQHHFEALPLLLLVAPPGGSGG